MVVTSNPPQLRVEFSMFVKSRHTPVPVSLIIFPIILYSVLEAIVSPQLSISAELTKGRKAKLSKIMTKNEKKLFLLTLFHSPFFS